MKIDIKNFGNVTTIENAIFNQNENSLSLFINTTKRDILPDLYEVGTDEIGLHYYDSESDNLLAKVLFKATTDLEREFLNCLHFESHCKDQLWIIFLKEHVWKTREIE